MKPVPPFAIAIALRYAGGKGLGKELAGSRIAFSDAGGLGLYFGVLILWRHQRCPLLFPARLRLF